MTGFSKLPCEIKENIFVWIRIRDLYEVSIVSEEWWWLSIKTFKGILREEDYLIKSLLDFYNREKMPPSPLMWFELIKYGNFCGVELDHIPDPLVMKNFLQSRKQIRCLYLRADYGSQANSQSRLDIALTYFPHLEKLKLKNFYVAPDSLKIPKRIKEVHLYEGRNVALENLFEDPESIQSLGLEVYKGKTFYHFDFSNLISLSLHFHRPLADHFRMIGILEFIRNHKRLKSVTLNCAKITDEWLKLFNETIENVRLEDIYIEKQLLTEWGNYGCYARQVMSYVCSDLTAVKRFYLDYMTKETREEVEEDGDTHVDYRAVYTCRPQLMQEELYLELGSSLSREVRTITSTDDGPNLQDLHIISTCVKAELLKNCVPATVKKFKLKFQGENKKLSIDELCQEPQSLEELEISKPTKMSNLPNCFAGLTNLKILYLADVSRTGIQNLLEQCVSLVKLTLDRPKRGCFTDLNPAIVSHTIREVDLQQSDASLTAVLYHCPNLEVLTLSSHLICPLSMPTAVTKLKLFSVMFDGFSDIRDDSASLALIMDTVYVPFKLFYLSKWRLKFILAQSDSFLKEVHGTTKYGHLYQKDGYAYCGGIQTRFLKARGIKILADIKLFSDHLNEIHRH